MKSFLLDMLVFLLMDFVIRIDDSYLFLLVYCVSCSVHTCLYL